MTPDLAALIANVRAAREIHTMSERGNAVAIYASERDALCAAIESLAARVEELERFQRERWQEVYATPALSEMAARAERAEAERDNALVERREWDKAKADKVEALEHYHRVREERDTYHGNWLRAEAECDAMRQVYVAALAWRDSETEDDDQQLENTLVAAIDAIAQPIAARKRKEKK